MVMREALTITVAGLVIGIVCARFAMPAIQSYLFGLKAADPLVTMCATGLLVVSSLVAGYGPARRASRIDPLVALRHE
jgi:ABC-type antimicrobial peptide transport system permease subunit